jgi:5-methylcytosine-specific restriction endonuclease McrA
MLDSSVLVLNRSYVPVHVTTARRAFSLIYQDVARVVNAEYRTLAFEEWVSADGSCDGDSVGTPSGAIRLPRVIVLRHFDRVPRRHVRYSRVNVFARDKYTCQYCGERPPRAELNLDHVVPRALGGRTTWENVVACCVECNRRKGGRTPHQARLRLQRRPERPRWTPLLGLVAAQPRYDEWRPFLGLVDGGLRPTGTD